VFITVSVHDMRLYKSREELSLMRKAAKISVQAHIKAMQICKPGVFEYELEAEFLCGFKRNGADWAYTSIVGGGANGCILHYTENNSPLNNKVSIRDMLLILPGRFRSMANILCRKKKFMKSY